MNHSSHEGHPAGRGSGGRSGSRGSEASSGGASAGSGAVQGKVAAAVRAMQAEVATEGGPAQLLRRLGQGGFGTVYHGALLPLPFAYVTLT